MPTGDSFADQLIALKVFAVMLREAAKARRSEPGPDPLGWGFVVWSLDIVIEELGHAWDHVDAGGLE